MRPLQPCGTTAAYARHLKLGEPTCDACKAAQAAAQRDYIARNPDRAWWRANPEKARARARAWQRKNRERYREQKRQEAAARRHGLSASEVFAEFWSSQEGRCYLCGDELQRDARTAQIDHDHDCCPPNKSCDYCRRGLACGPCNTIIAQAADDPDRLRRIADNFEPVLAATRARIAGKPEQQTLLLGVMR
jgi:hypothetical protein